MLLNLIVIKSKDIQALAEFYTSLGLSFQYHKHGNGLYHFSSLVGNVVFEIYPIESEIRDVLRLGFTVKDLDKKIGELKAKNYQIISEPKETEYGYVAVVEDLDGRKIELTEES